jgi:hypothetical protein
MIFIQARRALIALLPALLVAGPVAWAAGAPAAKAPAGHVVVPSGGPALSILDLMRASIEVPADGLWAAEGAEKLTDEDWLLVDQDSVQLIGAVSLLAKGGSGKNDAKWAANADWQKWVSDMQKTALALRAAGTAKDAAKLASAGDHLQEVCAGCHAKYRPAEPSDGMARYPFYPKRELPK